MIDLFNTFSNRDNEPDGDITYIVLMDEDGNMVAPEDLPYETIGEILSYLYENGDIEAGGTCVFTADESCGGYQFASSKDINFDCSGFGAFGRTRPKDKLEKNLMQIMELLKDSILYVCDGKDDSMTKKFLAHTETLCKEIKDMYYHGRELVGSR